MNPGKYWWFRQVITTWISGTKAEAWFCVTPGKCGKPEELGSVVMTCVKGYFGLDPECFLHCIIL